MKLINVDFHKNMNDLYHSFSILRVILFPFVYCVLTCS